MFKFNHFLRRSFRLNAESSSYIFEILFFLLLLLSISGINKLDFNLDIATLDDQSYKSVANLKDMQKIFGNAESLDFYIKRTDEKGLSNSDLCSVEKWLKELRQNFTVDSLYDLRYAKYEDGALWYYRYFNKESCNDVINVPKVFSNQIWNKYFYLKDGRTGKDILIQIKLSLEDVKNKKVDMIQKSFELYLGHQFSYHMYGQSSIKHYFHKALERDNYVNIIIIFLIFGFFYYAFRSFKISLLAFISIFISSVIVFGVMGLFGLNVTLINNCLFMMLTLAVVQDVIFIFTDYNNNNLSLKDTLEKMMIPCFYTSLTTVIGFFSMTISPLKHIREFGLEAGLGVIIEWFFLFYVFPRFVSGDWKKNKFKEIKFLKLSPNRFFYILSVGIFVSSLYYITKIRVEDKLSENFSAKHPHSKAIKYVNETRKWETQVSLLFDSNSETSEILKKVRRIKGVSDILSIDELKLNLSEGVPEIARDQVKLDFANLAYSKRLQKNGIKNVLVFLASNDLSFLERINNELSLICGEKCKVVGHPIVYQEFMEKVVSDLKESLLVCIMIITLTIFFIFKSFNQTKFLKIIFSILWGPVVLMGVMAFMNVPLQMTNTMAITVLLGLAGDNAIQYVFAAKNGDMETGIGARAMGTWFMSLFLILGCLPFLLMTYVPMQKMGLILIGGFILTFIGDYFLIKKVN